MDNRSHQETSWDEDLLGLELLDLKGIGIDLELSIVPPCEPDVNQRGAVSHPRLGTQAG
jgi:hypothetical protein